MTFYSGADRAPETSQARAVRTVREVLDDTVTKRVLRSERVLAAAPSSVNTSVGSTPGRVAGLVAVPTEGAFAGPQLVEPRRPGRPKGFKCSAETLDRMRQASLRRWARRRGEA